MSLHGKICIVTGATRGLGKGIAVQLGEAGATVYVTGRTVEPTPNLSGSLKETAEEIERRGGKSIIVKCDHSKDDDIKSLFDQVEKEQNGQLDLLVNNAYSAVTAIAETGLLEGTKKSFWEIESSMWDQVNDVGLRNHYICSVYASRLMVPKKEGLIINVSSPGGLRYLFNVAYGIGKAACDRMAADCAVELRKHNVAFLSLWPGAVKTEIITANLDKLHKGYNMFNLGETPEYVGKAVVNLKLDKNIMKKSGRILLTGDLGDEYGFKDIDGRQPFNLRSIKDLLTMNDHTWLASITPHYFKIPLWLLFFKSYKF